MKTPRDYLDRPIQLLYPLELHYNRYKTKTKQHKSDKKKLNVEAKNFVQREKQKLSHWQRSRTKQSTTIQITTKIEHLNVNIQMGAECRNVKV